MGAPHETGGKFHEMPCHRTLEGYLAEYIERARLDELEKPSNLGTTVLERRNSTASGFTEPIHGLWRRAKAAGITTEVSNPTFRGAAPNTVSGARLNPHHPSSTSGAKTASRSMKS